MYASLISRIAFWISRIRILDINNCILDINNSHFGYQQLHFGYQQFAFWISRIEFWISTIRIIDIRIRIRIRIRIIYSPWSLHNKEFTLAGKSPPWQPFYGANFGKLQHNMRREEERKRQPSDSAPREVQCENRQKPQHIRQQTLHQTHDMQWGGSRVDKQHPDLLPY